MTRRTFFRSGSVRVAGASLAIAGSRLSRAGNAAIIPPKIPISDAHIYLFAVSRPQGVPWPSRVSGIYRNALPQDCRQRAVPHGIAVAIAIECSPWLGDNQWLLDTKLSGLRATRHLLLPMFVNSEGQLFKFPRKNENHESVAGSENEIWGACAANSDTFPNKTCL
jgi:hypothetical protein